MAFLQKSSATGRSPQDDPEEYRLTLVEHLEELRDRIIKVVSILAVTWVIGWIIEPHLYSFLNEMVDRAVKPQLPKGADFKEVFHNATDMFMLKLKLSFVIGLVIAFPLIILQLWGFIAPGLRKREQEPFRRLAPLSFLLFALGASFAWYMMPPALSWFATYLEEFPGTSLYQEAGTMSFFVLKMMLAFGVAFQLPLVVYILGALELLSAETLMKYWRQASVAIFVIAAVVTPSQDPLTMTVMAVPLVGLFMISAYAVKITQRKKRRIAEELTVIENKAYQAAEHLGETVQHTVEGVEDIMFNDANEKVEEEKPE
ncbi:twin-arginine translocase subunit TatC [soil metagenome]